MPAPLYPRPFIFLVLLITPSNLSQRLCGGPRDLVTPGLALLCPDGHCLKRHREVEADAGLVASGLACPAEWSLRLLLLLLLTERQGS